MNHETLNIGDIRDDDELFAAIRRRDVADHTLSPDQAARRDALLASIVGGVATARDGALDPSDGRGRPDVAGDRSGEATVAAHRRQAGGRGGATAAGSRRASRQAGRPPSGRMRVARWAVPAAVAAGLAGVFALGNTVGSGPAYASWTPDPTPVTGPNLVTAEDSCRASLVDSLAHQGDVPADIRPTTDPASARTVVAERRGDFVFLSMVAADTSTWQCFFRAGDLSRPSGTTGGLATAQSPPASTVPVPPGTVEAGGAGSSSGPEGTYAFTVGRVDPGTKAVTVRTGGQTINASVADGHFAAWWPDRERAVNSVQPPIAFDVTRADGQVVTDAPNSFGDPVDGAPIGARQIGAIAQGGGVGEDGSNVATISGRAGADVVSVTVHADGHTVQAPVVDQVFTAQWPAPTAQGPGPATFDLHLRDGSVLLDQRPVTG